METTSADVHQEEISLDEKSRIMSGLKFVRFDFITSMFFDIELSNTLLKHHCDYSNHVYYNRFKTNATKGM